MTRRLVSAAVFVALPLAAILTVSQTRVTAQQPSLLPSALPPSCPLRVRPAARRARQDAPTPAPTSTSSPAAAGSRRTRCRRIARAGAGSTSCRSATTTRCTRSSRPPPRDATRSRRRSATTTRRASTRRRSTRRAPAPLDPLLKKIAALSSVSDLAPLVAELHTIGVNVFFQFGSQADFKDASVEMAIADQGGLGLPDRDYYFKDDAKSVELRTQYVDHVGEDVGAARRHRRSGDRRRRSRP